METWLPLLGCYLFIFFARVLDMSLDVIRVLMLISTLTVKAGFRLHQLLKTQ